METTTLVIPLPLLFYQRPDVVTIAKELIGKILCTNIDGKLTTARIVETEAYRGPEDRACHAYQNKKTKRNGAMFAMGGTAYVYQCYGLHHLFNVVTGLEEVPHAVLIRAVEPLVGIDTMLARRNFACLIPALTNGPGALTKALGITLLQNYVSLQSDLIWIEEIATDAPQDTSREKIIASPRVGIHYAGEDALLPWRFRLSESIWTSRKK